MIYDLEEIDQIFKDYKIVDPVLKESLNPFIRELQKVRDNELHKEAKDFLISYNPY